MIRGTILIGECMKLSSSKLGPNVTCRLSKNETKKKLQGTTRKSNLFCM